MKYKIAVVSLGCSKNIVDSEIMMGIIKKKKYEIVLNVEEANVIVVNTCGFINDAKKESIETIIQLGNLKESGECRYLIVTGCLSERYKEELIREMPEIDAILGTGNIDEIVEVIDKLREGEKIIRVGNVNNAYIEETMRILDNDSTTAYIKIAEGCDNYCTYCIIPRLRGKYRSRKMENIINEVNNLVDKGIREIILIAQDTTKYGIDIYGEYKLPNLLNELNKIDKLKWIRLHYMYPETFSDELIKSIRDNEKVLKYVDIPIQHINNDILRKMNRKTSKESITNLINKLRAEIDGICIRTTLIVGFPGETEEAFNELYEFVKNTNFERLGVFTYSREEDTPAAKLPNQIDEDVKIIRRDKIMQLQKDILSKINSRFIGKIIEVLIEEKLDKNIYLARSYMDSPEIDCNIYVYSEVDDLEQKFVNVRIFNSFEYDLEGELINESCE